MAQVQPGSTLRAGIVVVSDRAAAGQRPDECAPQLRRRLGELGFTVVLERVLPDGVEALAAELSQIADAGLCDILLCSGGTGLAPRDLTPEATLRAGERQVPGLMELARRRCGEKTPFAALSRGVAVTRARTLIVDLPGHPRAAIETLDAIADLLPHAVGILAAPPVDCPVTGRGPEEQSR
jgi:molybdenum cofactor synthesis domain-containing protein